MNFHEENARLRAAIEELQRKIDTAKRAARAVRVDSASPEAQRVREIEVFDKDYKLVCVTGVSTQWQVVSAKECWSLTGRPKPVWKGKKSKAHAVRRHRAWKKGLKKSKMGRMRLRLMGKA